MLPWSLKIEINTINLGIISLEMKCTPQMYIIVFGILYIINPLCWRNCSLSLKCSLSWIRTHNKRKMSAVLQFVKFLTFYTQCGHSKGQRYRSANRSVFFHSGSINIVLSSIFPSQFNTRKRMLLVSKMIYRSDILRMHPF